MENSENYIAGKEAFLRGDAFKSCPFTFANSGVSLQEYDINTFWQKSRTEWAKGWIDAKKWSEESPTARGDE